MKNRLLAIICIIWSLPSFGQVIVPSLDSALPVELASAVAWRIGSTVGLETEFVSQDGDASNDAGTDNIKNAVLLAYQPGNFIGELYYAPFVKTATQIDSKSSTVTWEDNKGSSLALRIAIRGNRKVSVGIGYERFAYEMDSESYVNSQYEGSFSFRLFEGLLYAGGGMQRVTLDLGSDDSLKYNRIIGGAAIQIGDPTDIMFQMEAAVRLNPETESDKGFITKVPKTTDSQLNVEFMTSSFFVSYKYSKVLYEDVQAGEDITDTVGRYGGGLKFGGLTLGLYRKTKKSEFMDSHVEYDTYTLTAGYSFL